MDGVGVEFGGRDRPVEVLDDLGQLPMEVLPFPDAQEVEVLALTHAPKAAAGQLLALFAEVPPQLHVGQEVRLRDDEAPVLGVGGLPVLGRPFPWIGERHRGGDHEKVVETTQFVSGDEHPGDPGIDRDPRHRPADRGQSRGPALARDGDGAEFGENTHTVADRAVVGRLDERELGDLTQFQRGHLEDDRREVGAQDLRVGEGRPGVEVVLAVETDADARGDTTASTGPLPGTGL